MKAGDIMLNSIFAAFCILFIFEIFGFIWFGYQGALFAFFFLNAPAGFIGAIIGSRDNFWKITKTSGGK